MKRMKTFFIYLLLVILVIVATNFIPKLVLDLNYKPITSYEIETTSPEIKITEAKTTKANGKIKGTITNKTDVFMENYFIKIDLLSDIGNILGEEFLQAGNFQPGQSKEFELNYRYSNVKSFTISATNEVSEREIQYHPLIEHAREYYLIARFIVFASTPTFFLLAPFLK